MKCLWAAIYFVTDRIMLGFMLQPSLLTKLNRFVLLQACVFVWLVFFRNCPSPR